MEKSLGSSTQKPLDRPSSAVWDCGSALYDSFELKSFNRQLDSAISARTLSMPHLPDRRALPAPPPPPLFPQPQPKPAAKKRSGISRSIQKLLRSVFKTKPSPTPAFGAGDRYSRAAGGGDGFYVLYDKSGALTTIPEAPEVEFLGKLSPEMDRFVRKTASERFAPSSIGISCA
ncbi:hypothetical protein BT93_D2038 [Corymbia citriodora subsp. variegata]|nr:hypothetical protein BT93_D2038 [Corymbia citriodora subsp. variegata]KAF8033310.1 hypothetical protein BT93_D2038 [Corymbia citriodora subsp. variegata]